MPMYFDPCMASAVTLFPELYSYSDDDTIVPVCYITLIVKSYVIWFGLGTIIRTDCRAIHHQTVGRILHCPLYRGSEAWLRRRDQSTLVYSLLK